MIQNQLAFDRFSKLKSENLQNLVEIFLHVSICSSIPVTYAAHFSKLLERALRALASSSGGAACPGGTRGQPRGSTSGVRG